MSLALLTIFLVCALGDKPLPLQGGPPIIHIVHNGADDGTHGAMRQPTVHASSDHPQAMRLPHGSQSLGDQQLELPYVFLPEAIVILVFPEILGAPCLSYLPCNLPFCNTCFGKVLTAGFVSMLFHLGMIYGAKMCRAIPKSD